MLQSLRFKLLTEARRGAVGLQLAPLSMGEGGEGEEDGDRLRSTTIDDEESDVSLSAASGYKKK